MAYAFNKIDQYLRGRQTGASIPGGSTQPQKGTPMPQGGGQNRQQNAQTDAQTGTARGILEKAGTRGTGAVATRVLDPGFKQLARLESDIGEGAKNYVASEQAKINEMYKAPTDIGGTVTKAATGDQDATGKLVQGLNAPEYKPVAPPREAVDTLAPTEYLRSGNVGTYLQKQSGGRYTPGMGLIDQMAFARSGGGKVTQQALGALQSKAQGLIGSAEKAGAGLEDYSTTQRKALQDSIRQAITEKQTALEAAINQAIAARQGVLSSEDAAERAALEGELGRVYGEESKGLGLEKPPALDTGKYITETSQEELYDPAEIAQYNALANILGLPLKTAASVSNRSYASDPDALRAMLRESAKIQQNGVLPGTPETPVPMPGQITIDPNIQVPTEPIFTDNYPEDGAAADVLPTPVSPETAGQVVFPTEVYENFGEDQWGQPTAPGQVILNPETPIVPTAGTTTPAYDPYVPPPAGYTPEPVIPNPQAAGAVTGWTPPQPTTPDTKSPTTGLNIGPIGIGL